MKGHEPSLGSPMRKVNNKETEQIGQSEGTCVKPYIDLKLQDDFFQIP